MAPGKKKILIIDDSKDIAGQIRVMLEEAGYEISLAHTAKLGLESVSRFSPDLILLDLVLPDASGFHLAQEIRALEGKEQVPIIAVSFKKEDIDKHVAARLGFVAYLEKPISKDALLFCLRDILETQASP